MAPAPLSPLQSVSRSAPPPEAQPILLAVGEQLQQARLEQGLSLAELARRLKMGQEQLSALESGDASQLPEPVFVIAQIRRVAEVLGVNAEASIQALRQTSAPQAGEPVVAAPRGGLPWRPLLLALVLVPALGWLGVRGWQQLQFGQLRLPRFAPEASPPAPPPAPTAKSATTPPEPAATSLTLSSPEPSWLAVRDSQGRALFEGSFSGERSFPLGQGLEVLAGRPDLVEARLGDGQTQPLGPIQAVRWRRFTPPKP